ncbi:transposase [Streptomyces lavendulae]|uniref:transposase n=1 Tax=Streptomyces lavendulae TaxID=1914 RepID=UPI00367B8682
MVGKAQASAIGTLVDRTTRYTRLIHLPDGWKAPQIRDALAEQTADLPSCLRRALTWDQGRELYLHQEIEDLTGFRIYFCDPHSPLAARHEREHKRTPARVPPERHRPHPSHRP